MVEVRDNDPGIPPEVQAHIFEPFFTTKPVDEGTGHGLDTSMRVVLKHRGNLRFYTKPGDTYSENVITLRFKKSFIVG